MVSKRAEVFCREHGAHQNGLDSGRRVRKKFEEHAAATSRPSSVLGEAAKYSRFTLNKETTLGAAC